MPRLRKLAQRAGIVCNEGAFHRYLDVANKDEAAARLRRMCMIGSRSELDTDPEASEIFQEIMTGYEAWLRE